MKNPFIPTPNSLPETRAVKTLRLLRSPIAHRLFAPLIFVLAAVAIPQVSRGETIGRVERLDPAIDTLVAPEAMIEVLASGFTWTEGPVWVADDQGGHLLFTDIPRNSIFSWSAARGIELFMSPSGYTGISFYGLEPGANGLALDPQGRLVMCEHGDRRVSVLTEGGGKMTLVDSFEGKRLNSPNDLCFDAAGSLFFTDPPYGLPLRADDPRRELDFCGVYRLDPNRQLTLLTKQLARPNGIGLSPDQKTLYVAQSDPELPIWMAFPINDDKTLGEGVTLHNAKAAMSEFPGLPDGLAVHPSGVIFGSGPGGVYVLTPDAKLLGRIITGGRVSNCTLSPDNAWLYITADSQLCRIALKKP
jgi:gluconolactonase